MFQISPENRRVRSERSHLTRVMRPALVAVFLAAHAAMSGCDVSSVIAAIRKSHMGHTRRPAQPSPPQHAALEHAVAQDKMVGAVGYLLSGDSLPGMPLRFEALNAAAAAAAAHYNAPPRKISPLEFGKACRKACVQHIACRGFTCVRIRSVAWAGWIGTYS